MATSNMMQRPMGGDTESPAEDAAPGDEPDGSTELVIKINPAGEISVYKETGEDESAEQTAEQMGTFGEALSWCLRQYKAMSGESDAVGQLQAGFGGPQPKPTMAG